MADTIVRRSRSVFSLHNVLAFAAVFVLAFVHGTAPAFLYDAAQYWGGPTAMLSGGDAALAGRLATRGVYTAVLYLPPALVSSLLGPASAVWTVLAWNAAATAALCVALVPRLAVVLTAGSPGRPTGGMVWTSAILGAAMLSGFARFPLVDVWSVGFALWGIYLLLATRRRAVIIVAGVLLTVATNIRPSLLAPVALVLVAVVVLRGARTALAAVGAAVALLPQVVVNAGIFSLWSAVPQETGPLSAVQAVFAPFALRYDTVAFAEQSPQQWYCDPSYAKLVAGDPVARNQLEVIGSAFAHLPDSVWFLTRKVAAAVHWTWATPYEQPPGSGPDALTLIVVFVASLGLVALVARCALAGKNRTARLGSLALLGFWVGSLGTLMVSTTETRFALPLVMVGLVGVVMAARARSWAPRYVHVGVAAALGVALAVALLLAGSEALTHALPPGPIADAASCVAADVP